MKIITSKKFASSKGPKMDTLKKNRKSLTEEERKEVMSRGAVWHHGPNGEETPAVWKAEVDGKMWYVCNTHRAYQCKPTLKGAINSYDFIETTANNKKEIKVSSKTFIGNCVNGLEDQYFQDNLASDATELAQLVENGQQINLQEFFNIQIIYIIKLNSKIPINRDTTSILFDIFN